MSKKTGIFIAAPYTASGVDLALQLERMLLIGGCLSCGSQASPGDGNISTLSEGGYDRALPDDDVSMISEDRRGRDLPDTVLPGCESRRSWDCPGEGGEDLTLSPDELLITMERTGLTEEQLRCLAAAVDVYSDWYRHVDEHLYDDKDQSSLRVVMEAKRNLSHLYDAQILVVLYPEHSTTGGTFVELGVAYARNYNVIVVSNSPDNIYLHLADAIVDSVGEAVRQVAVLLDIAQEDENEVDQSGFPERSR